MRTTAILLLFLLTFSAVSSELAEESGADDDLEGLEELLAIDEELEKEGGLGRPSSDAKVLSRAQKIVTELSNENARKVVEGNEYVMVLGYTPWCERSAELMPKFAEAATALKEMGSPIVMAKLDAERHTKAASLFGIKGFPTLLLFVNGSAQPYKGGFSAEELVIWARKKTGSPVIKLSSVAAATEFLARYPTYVVGFLEKGNQGLEYQEFVKAAAADNEIQFVETNDNKVTEILFPGATHKNNFLGLVKAEPERFLTFDEAFEEEKILTFIEYNKFPLVTIMTEKNSAWVYASAIKLQVFVIAESDELKKFLPFIQDVARKFRTKIMFVYVDSAEDNLAKPFLTLFGIDSDKPIVLSFNSKIGTKYLLEFDITASNLEEFCNGLLNGTLSPYFRSEPIPDTKGTVEKVVGRTFAASVLESPQNVFLEIYTQWCMDCEAVTKRVEKLGKHFKGRDDIIIAKIDASLNEHPDLQISNYPTLLFYHAKNKSNPIKVSKKSSLKDMIDLIETHVKSQAQSAKDDEPAKDEL